MAGDGTHTHAWAAGGAHGGTHPANVAHGELEGLLRALAEGEVVHADVNVRVVRDELEIARGAVEAAAQAALGDPAQLGLALPIRLRLVEAVLKEKAEDAPRDDQERSDDERARREAQRAPERAEERYGRTVGPARGGRAHLPRGTTGGEEGGARVGRQLPEAGARTSAEAKYQRATAPAEAQKPRCSMASAVHSRPIVWYRKSHCVGRGVRGGRGGSRLGGWPAGEGGAAACMREMHAGDRAPGARGCIACARGPGGLPMRVGPRWIASRRIVG